MRARTITTAAELDALPCGSIIRDKFKDSLEKWPDGWHSFETAVMPSSYVRKWLPATVLYEPVAQ